MAPSYLFFAFLKYIFGIEVWLIPFGIMYNNPNLNKTDTFSVYIFPTLKSLLSFMEKFTPYCQTLIFEEQLCMSNMDFFQAQINSVEKGGRPERADG